MHLLGTGCRGGSTRRPRASSRSEVVEEEAHIQEVLPELDTMIGGDLVTLEKARVILYRSGGL